MLFLVDLPFAVKSTSSYLLAKAINNDIKNVIKIKYSEGITFDRKLPAITLIKNPNEIIKISIIGRYFSL